MERTSLQNSAPIPLRARQTSTDPWQFLGVALRNAPAMAWRSPGGGDSFVAWGSSEQVTHGRSSQPSAESVPWIVGGFPFALPSDPEVAEWAWGQSRLWRPKSAVRRRDHESVQMFGAASEARHDLPDDGQGAAPTSLDWRPEPSRCAYEASVREAVSAIADGALQKVVLARSVLARTERGQHLSVAHTARAMAMAYPNATTYVVAMPNGEVLCGATPETIAHVENGILRTQAVAGTGTTGALLHSAKDRHEHDLVVTDITEALGSIGLDVSAAATPRVVATGDFAHLVTPIQARLPQGMGVLEVVACLHPTAALCGTPRPVARGWIREHEEIDRGWYGGPIGWADAEGNGTFAVALRCALFAADRRSVRCFGGAGIVARSDAALEHEETAAKMRAAQRCVRVEFAR